MKAKDLISLLQNNPDAKVVVSTVSYYEKVIMKQDMSGCPPQYVESVTVDLEYNQIQIDGGNERTI